MPSGAGVSGASPDGASGAKSIQIPKTNLDPVWSLRPWPVVIQAAGETFEIPALPAADWLEFLMVQPGADVWGLIETLLPEVEDLFFENMMPLEELYDLALEVISVASARKWWVTIRLASATTHSWHIIGPQMIKFGADATVLSLAAWLDVALYLLITSMKPDDVTMFTLKLEAPPAEETEAGEGEDLMETMTMDQGAFLALGR